MAKAKAGTGKAAGENDVCFVIMPFGGWFDNYYRSIYCPAINSAGLSPHRADDLFRPSTIVTDIWSYTKRAKVLVADLTGKNANVFYELGLAHALAKPAILVAESMDDIPFDLRALRVLLYDKNAPDWGAELQKKVENALREVVASPAEAVLPAFLDVRSDIPRPTVSHEQRDFIELKQEMDLLRRELRSRSSQSSTDIGPDGARSLIKALVQQGASDDDITDMLKRVGAPSSWTRLEIDEARDSDSEKK